MKYEVKSAADEGFFLPAVHTLNFLDIIPLKFFFFRSIKRHTHLGKDMKLLHHICKSSYFLNKKFRAYALCMFVFFVSEINNFLYEIKSFAI